MRPKGIDSSSIVDRLKGRSHRSLASRLLWGGCVSNLTLGAERPAEGQSLLDVKHNRCKIFCEPGTCRPLGQVDVHIRLKSNPKDLWQYLGCHWNIEVLEESINLPRVRNGCDMTKHNLDLEIDESPENISIWYGPMNRKSLQHA